MFKRITAVFLSFITIILVFSACNKNPDVPSFIVTNTGSDIDGISISVKEFKYTSDEKQMTVEWNNETDNEFMYPDSFDILYLKNGKYESCATEELVFNSIANIIMPHKTREMQYPLSSFDVSKKGKYRFKVELSDGKYVWADFEKGDESFTAVAEEKPNVPFRITATVLEVREKSILVNEDGKEYGEINVSLDKVKNVPDLHVGDKVRIYYTGGIAESYPAQINKAAKIEVLESKVSVYTYNESPEPIKPRIELHPDYNFVFIDSYLSSKFAYTGKYEVSQSEIRLKTDDGKIFAFKNNGDETFTFDTERSAELQKYRYSENEEFEYPVPNGAVFKLKQ